MAKFRLITLLGIRPDLIRMFKLIKLLDKGQEQNNFEHIFVHSGQHYDYQLDNIFYKDLDIRKPDFNLNIGKTLKKSGINNQAYQSALLFKEVFDLFTKIKPDAVMYLGDTNTVTSSLIVAKMGIPVIHIEGGGRSFDWRMPEEKNRTTIDHLSDSIYVYLQRYQNILVSEGIPKYRIKVVGNIIVDAINHFMPKADSRIILKKLKIRKKEYILCTLHREENIEAKREFVLKIKDLIKLSKTSPVIFPVMPRVKVKLKEYSLYKKLKSSNVILTEPLGFLDFLNLEKNARMIITDSGTVQEESLILGVPCLVARRSTERPETINAEATVMSENSLYENALITMELDTGWDKNILNPTGKSPSETIYMDLVVKMKSGYFNDSRAYIKLKKNIFVRQAYNK